MLMIIGIEFRLRAGGLGGLGPGGAGFAFSALALTSPLSLAYQDSLGP